jgi:hypothetical protein
MFSRRSIFLISHHGEIIKSIDVSEELSFFFTQEKLSPSSSETSVIFTICNQCDIQNSLQYLDASMIQKQDYGIYERCVKACVCVCVCVEGNYTMNKDRFDNHK